MTCYVSFSLLFLHLKVKNLYLLRGKKEMGNGDGVGKFNPCRGWGGQFNLRLGSRRGWECLLIAGTRMEFETSAPLPSLFVTNYFPYLTI